MSSEVLVVDDEKDVREFLHLLLVMEGYQVVEAADGATALRLASARKPGLILLDWMLPDTTGLEVLRRLRAVPETALTPILMLTAHHEESGVSQALAEGATSYLAKPFEAGMVLLAVQAHLAPAHT